MPCTSSIEIESTTAACPADAHRASLSGEERHHDFLLQAGGLRTAALRGAGYDGGDRMSNQDLDPMIPHDNNRSDVLRFLIAVFTDTSS
jgi:hypothetical protein